MTSVEGFLAHPAEYREAASSGSIRSTGDHLHEPHKGLREGFKKVLSDYRHRGLEVRLV
jgi:hypothetical protein